MSLGSKKYYDKRTLDVSIIIDNILLDNIACTYELNNYKGIDCKIYDMYKYPYENNRKYIATIEIEIIDPRGKSDWNALIKPKYHNKLHVPLCKDNYWINGLKPYWYRKLPEWNKNKENIDYIKKMRNIIKSNNSLIYNSFFLKSNIKMDSFFIIRGSYIATSKIVYKYNYRYKWNDNMFIEMSDIDIENNGEGYCWCTIEGAIHLIEKILRRRLIKENKRVNIKKTTSPPDPYIIPLI